MEPTSLLEIKKAKAKELANQIEALEKNESKTQEINEYKDICHILQVDPSDESIKIEIPGFDEQEIDLMRNLAKLIRISKVANKGILPKRGEYRYYPYYNISSGFVSSDTTYAYSGAHSGSASRLCFLKDSDAIDAAMKFPEVFKGIIGF